MNRKPDSDWQLIVRHYKNQICMHGVIGISNRLMERYYIEKINWHFTMMNEIMEDYIEAHKFCNNNMPTLKKDSLCGCFYCLSIFNPAEIDEWIIDDNESDKLGTAICPYCGIDSVIAESAGYPITKEFLAKMQSYWF